MSIDIDLVINTGKTETVVCEVGNMTHNVQPMWRKALDTTAGVDMNLCDFDGMLAGEAITLLAGALEHMTEFKDEYTPLNPSNGWGSYDTAIEYLAQVLQACMDHPACIIRTDC